MLSDAMNITEEQVLALMRKSSHDAGHFAAAGAENDDQGGSALDEEQLMQWMWADAGFSSMLARANPLRWSKKLTPGDMREELLKQTAERPVVLHLCGQGAKVNFSSAPGAAEWIGESVQEINHQTPASATLGLIGAASLLAPAACTLFLRRNAKTTWLQKNVIAAAFYARRITQLPHQVASSQLVDLGAHKRRVETSYEVFEASDAKPLIAFIDAASLPMDSRPQEIDVEGKTWACVENAPFWMGWLHAETGNSVIAFRGGDGGTDDACNHPGSPVRAFVHGDDDALPPKLPTDLMRTLSTAASEARKQGGNGGISMVGYSQGAIPALASALMFGASTMEQDTLTRVELLNAAMMFWPTWYPSILSSDWWTNPPPVSCKITSWLIKDDPLSEGLPGAGGFRVPMSPGTSIVLPPKHFDKDIMQNHSLDNFR